METVVPPPADAELHLLTEWGDPNSGSRTRTATVLSVVVHAVVIVTLALLPPGVVNRPPAAQAHRVITPLIEPPTELTQKAPNTGKVSKEFNAAEVEERPRIQMPAAIPSTSRARAERASLVPSVAAPKPAPPTPLPEPPKVEAIVKEPPRNDLPQMAPAPPPQIQPEEKPKIMFESPSAVPSPLPPGQSRIPIPNTSVAEAMRQVIRGNVSGGGVTVGDQDSPGQGGYGSGINLPPSPGAPASQLQLLSDPMGVDFRPYLIRVLTTVKLHWLAVIPESVRLGRRGKVAIQFSIARNGSVPKLVIATPSGADALDRAAVAGVSASVPFPPLPAEFKGDRIVLQFNFAYNSAK
jgi:TonB family protein